MRVMGHVYGTIMIAKTVENTILVFVMLLTPIYLMKLQDSKCNGWVILGLITLAGLIEFGCHRKFDNTPCRKLYDFFI